MSHVEFGEILMFKQMAADMRQSMKAGGQAPDDACSNGQRSFGICTRDTVYSCAGCVSN